MENSQIMMEEKQLGFFDLIKESLKIPFRNPNFIIFAFFSSLPLFFFLIMYETVFQQTMIKAGKNILQEEKTPLHIFDYDVLEATEMLIREISSKFLLLSLLYFVILHLLDLFNMIGIVDIASMIYKGEKAMNLKVMLSRCIYETRLKGPLITSIHALLLDSLISIGLVSLVMYMYLGRSISFFFSFAFFWVFACLLSKYIDWSAVWNMGILISILEEKNGNVALTISAYLSRGSRRYGFLLMLAFFAWRYALRLAFIYIGWHIGGSGVAITTVHVIFVCLAKIWLWLMLMVYFYDCKKRSAHKKIDVEGGQEET